MIDVVIPVYNKRAFLEVTLGSILDAASQGPVVRVFVVDNGSTDGSWAIASKLCMGRGRLVRSSATTIAAVRNVGAGLGHAPIISFLDCDCVVAPSYFAALEAVFSCQDVTAAGCNVDFPQDGPWVERVWDQLHRSGEVDAYKHYLNAANFAIRRDAFNAIGGFDERLITGEDTAIGRALSAHNYRILETRRLAVVHVDNPRTLGAFFRKEVWRGIEMLRISRLWPPDLPMAATLAHAVVVLAALGWLASGWGSLGLRALGALGLSFAIPISAVAFRALVLRRAMPWFLGALLYQTFFAARATACFRTGAQTVTRLR